MWLAAGHPGLGSQTQQNSVCRAMTITMAHYSYVCNQARCKYRLQYFCVSCRLSCLSCVNFKFNIQNDQFHIIHYKSFKILNCILSCKTLNNCSVDRKSFYLILADIILIRSLYLFRFDTRAPLSHTA